MSVAFRRESDEEHLEPKFELPIPPGPNLVTAAGLAQVAARVEEIEAGLPALTDDDAKKAARRDLKYWRQRLATAELVPVAKGDKVRVLNDEDPNFWLVDLENGLSPALMPSAILFRTTRTG